MAFKDPTPLRLNRPAKLKGEGKYYFGLPVTTGTVRWRVTREPIYPWWWSYRYGFWAEDVAERRAQTVATGTSKLDENGGFSIEFLPKVEEQASEKADAKDLSYRYSVSADLTDEGGETRSAQRTFRLGLVSVEATVADDKGF